MILETNLTLPPSPPRAPRGNNTKTKQVPTIFWFLPPTEQNLRHVACAGVYLSAFVTWRGASNMPIMFSLWVLYHSIVNVGQTWYSFGERTWGYCTAAMFTLSPRLFHRSSRALNGAIETGRSRSRRERTGASVGVEGRVGWCAGFSGAWDREPRAGVLEEPS